MPTINCSQIWLADNKKYTLSLEHYFLNISSYVRMGFETPFYTVSFVSFSLSVRHQL